MWYLSSIGKTFELTKERLSHIFEFHPDLKPFFDKLQETLIEPDEIRISNYDRDVLLFYKFYDNILNGKYFAVVVKINERNFILTAYLTDLIMTGEPL